jgi:hypothetical protein
MNKISRILILLLLLVFPFTASYCAIIDSTRNVANSDQFLEKIGLSNKDFKLIYRYDNDDTVIVNIRQNTKQVKEKDLLLKNLTIPYRMLFINARISNLEFNNCRFLKGVSLDHSNINVLTISYCNFFYISIFDCEFIKSNIGPTNIFRTFEVISCLFKEQFSFVENLVKDAFSFHTSKSYFFVKNCLFYGYASFGKDTLVDLGISYSHFYNSVKFYKSSIIKVKIENSEFDRFSIIESYFQKFIELSHVNFGESLTIWNSTLQEGILGERIIYPDYLSLIKVKTSSKLDFTDFNPPKTFSKNCTFSIYDVPINNLTPNINFLLSFNSELFKGLDNELLNATHKKLLESLKENGYEVLYKKFDLDYKLFYYKTFLHQPILYHVQKWWWNFGYEKYLVIFNTLKILLFFTFIVYFTGIKRYIFNDYIINSLCSRYDQNQKIKNLFLKEYSDYLIALIFTSNIFFGFGLKMENLSFSNYWRFFLIILIYLSGLISVLFILNFIITAK